jgi:hypothetical protein
MPNRLADCQSLYLRKHADNPIDWWPWIPEALDKARAENKPIFLSIGYSSCHWCTVMEGEAFSNPTIAAYMNTHFIPIKLDREERPDLDSIYMQSLQLMSGQGGWPLNVFLTPEDLVPFYAGTYFPVEPRYGRPGFLEILQRVRQFYDQQPDKIAQHKTSLLQALDSLTQLDPAASLAPDLLAKGISQIVPIVSNMGARQQFPMMPYAQLVLRAARFQAGQEGAEALERAQQRGMDLVLGGIFDHVGGGFHRYTVDPTWTVPHFEKMLYDNGQILEFLSDLWANGVQDAALERAVQLTVEWLAREMTAPAGYFYAAQDADSFADPSDSEPEEGEFYVWQWAELAEVLSEMELQQLNKAFDLSRNGNFGDRPGYIVLQRLTGGDLSPEVETALRQKLFAVRYGQLEGHPFPPAQTAQQAKGQPWPGRIPPVTDTKMIVAWNSLMISGLARAYQVFGHESYLQMAARAADFILNAQQPEGCLQRLNYNGHATVSAKSEDYALLIKALLDLHQASLAGNPSTAAFRLDQAIALQMQMDGLLWDATQGGYFVSDPEQSSDLLIREKEFQDNATPSANGVAIANLIRLTAATSNLDYLDRAEQSLRAFEQILSQQPRVCPSLLTALDWYQNFLKVTVAGDRLSAIQRQSWPTTMFVDPATQDPLLPETVGLVCVGLKCLAPALSLDQMRSQMQQGQNRT